MSRFFNPDNPIMEFIAKIFDLILLNLIFIFSCVPIITIGASTSALSYVTLKMVRGEDPYIWQNFWKSFRQNFKQGTLIWVFSILVFIFLGMDFYIINSQNTTLFAVIRILLWCVCLVALSVFLYVFPIISHFVCSTTQALKNAVDLICKDNLIGRSQLQKLFKEQCNRGIIEYFSILKIEVAKELIRTNHMNFTQISAHLGYTSIHYFSRQFKKIVGMTPSEYASSVKAIAEGNTN